MAEFDNDFIVKPGVYGHFLGLYREARWGLGCIHYKAYPEPKIVLDPMEKMLQGVPRS